MKSTLLALLGTGVLCLISTSASAVEVIEQTFVFNLDTPEAATIEDGFIVDPGRNMFTFGGLSFFPIGSVMLTGQVAIHLRIDDTTDEVLSLRFAPENPAQLDTDSPINYFVENLGYLHIGENVDPIPNPAPGTPEFVATGNPIAKIVPRISGWVDVGPGGVFDADRQSLMVTSGQYIASGLIASAFIIPSGSIRDTSIHPLIVTSQSLDPDGDMGLISVTKTSSGYRGNLQLNLSGQFGHVIISASTVPEPSSAIFLTTMIATGAIVRRRRAGQHSV